MKAALYSIPRTAFDIEPNFDNAIRIVLENRITTWEWSVIPKRAGRGILSLHIISVSSLLGSTEEGPSWVKRFSVLVEQSQFFRSPNGEETPGVGVTPGMVVNSAWGSDNAKPSPPSILAAPGPAPPGFAATAVDLSPTAADGSISGYSSINPIEPKSSPLDLGITTTGTEQTPVSMLVYKTFIGCIIIMLLVAIVIRYLNGKLIIDKLARSLKGTKIALVNKDGLEHNTPQFKEVILSQDILKPERIKILILAANPRATTQLRLDEEVREIQGWLSRAQYERSISDSNAQDYLELSTEWAVRVSDLQFLLQKHRPHILHFSGHGALSSGIILEDQMGSAKLVTTESLRNLLSVLKDNLRCVVLNACYTQQQASVIAQSIDCVVGMSQAVQDQTAIQFAAAFYQALAFGRTLKDAYLLGQAQAQIIGQHDYDAPQLITREGIDAAEVRFLHKKRL